MHDGEDNWEEGLNSPVQESPKETDDAEKKFILPVCIEERSMQLLGVKIRLCFNREVYRGSYAKRRRIFSQRYIFKTFSN